MKSLFFIILSILYTLPIYAQTDTTQLHVWRKEVRAYLNNEGEMYEHLGNEAGIRKWLRKNTHLDRKRLPHEILLMKIDSNRKATTEWVKVNNNVREGVIWTHLVVNEEGKAIRIEFLKRLFPIFEEGLYNALVIMPFKKATQPFRDYFLAVAFIRQDDYWTIEIL